MQKSTMLFVSSILLVIFGGIIALGGLFMLIGGGAAASLGGVAGASLGGIAIVMALVLLAVAAFELVGGILGIKNHKSPEKAGVCVKFGIVMLVVQVIGVVINIASGQFSFVSTVIGFVLPVVYYMGAKQLSEMQQ